MMLVGSSEHEVELVEACGSERPLFSVRVSEVETLVGALEHHDVQGVVLVWEAPFQDVLIDVVELLSQTPVVIWNRSKEEVLPYHSWGATGCFDHRHLKAGLVLETLATAFELHKTEQALKDSRMKLSELRMDEWDRKDRLERQRQALLSLARYKFKDGNFKVGLKKVARLCQEMLGVDRVSVWLARKLDGRLHFVVQEGVGEPLKAGVLLESSESSLYLEELERGEPIAMATLKGAHLYDPQGPTLLNGEKTSLVDVPIFFNGRVKGLLRAEVMLGPKDWDMEDLNFIDALADVVSMALEQEDREKISQMLKEKEQDYLQRLEKSNSELQEFASVVSHDLQEPLYKVKAFGEVLMSKHAKSLSEEGHFIVGRMQDAGQRMSRLIDDLLTYSRVSSKGQAFEWVDLNKVLKGVLSDLEVRILECGAKLNIEPLPKVWGDSLQLGQLFQNLISNAIKFSKPEDAPYIELGHRKSDEGTVLWIEDNGVGFDQKYADKIFGVFQRVKGKEAKAGTGIGLAIAKKIVLRHQGYIRAMGEEGKGARFEIVLGAKPEIIV